MAGSLVTGDEEVGGGPLAESLVTSDEEVGGAVAGSLVTADEENPPPKSMLKSSNIFFRLSARSSNTHQRGFIWSAILTPMNFREKTRLQSGDTLF